MSTSHRLSTLPAPCPNHTSWAVSYCLTCQGWNVLVGLAMGGASQMDYSSQSTAHSGLEWLVRNDPHGDLAKTALSTFYPRGWKESIGQVFMFDVHCEECDEWVSSVLPADKDHWDSICGECGQHDTNCELCGDCGEHVGSCECCTGCGLTSWNCNCCSHCGINADECDCTECEGCGSNVPEGSECGYCGHQAYRFGKSTSLPWTERSDSSGAGTPVPDMSEVDLNVDPVRAAADYYLLDALVHLVRLSEVSGMPAMPRKEQLVADDDHLGASIVAARRYRDALIERLDREFLTYAVNAVGGELRYHRAAQGIWPTSDRSECWSTFAGVVSDLGADVLFDAAGLFREYPAGKGYGGELWAAAAEIVGKRLQGRLPAWLFVDRMFTLEHNGGCFLNKVNWKHSNRLGYNLYHMRKVLDAHASSEVDWKLLLGVCSPEVAQMFQMADSALSRIVRRKGGVLAPVVPYVKKAPKKDSHGVCTGCGYYGCMCE